MKRPNYFQYLFYPLLLMAAIWANTACNSSNGGRQVADIAEGDSITKEEGKSLHPEWSKNLSIYEVNIRQYTPEGTFKAFQQYLPKIKELGTDILWIMPIHPIGEKNRKGELGSYYAVQDYTAVNPEFGTMEEFKDLIKSAHALGMYVIIDWVPNHTAWDHEWAKNHPDWYVKDDKGAFIPPLDTDWTDVIQLDYKNKELRAEMIEALEFWVREADLDGYRCDVAGKVPTDFWNEVRPALDKIRPVFMLAEWEATDLHEKAFDMTYAWTLYDLMHQVAEGKKNAADLKEHFVKELKTYPADAYRMNFVDNHDKNSWEGTMFKFGKGLETFVAFTCIAKGMPLVYTGQEIGLDRSLKFFEKDPITWKPTLHPVGKLYKKLLNFKKNNAPLWNGNFGGSMDFIENDQANDVLSFIREKEGQRVIGIFNFSAQSQKVTLKAKGLAGQYKDVVAEQNTDLEESAAIELKAWEYRILAN